jgi:hypothetical protein
MLRHKVIQQCARLAFNISSIEHLLLKPLISGKSQMSSTKNSLHRKQTDALNQRKAKFIDIIASKNQHRQFADHPSNLPLLSSPYPQADGCS